MPRHILSTVAIIAILSLFLLSGADGEIGASAVQDWDPSLQTFSVAGKGEYVLNGSNEADLCNHKGSGCLTHLWFGGAWQGYEKTRIRIYVDGETTPSIDMEIGLGHGVGFGDPNSPWGSEKMGKTGTQGGIYDTFKIPYGKSVRVTAQRPKGLPNGPFWWIVHGTDGMRVVLGGVRLPAKARLKLYKVEDYTAKPLEEVTMCDVKGQGALYQTTITMHGLTDTGGWHALSFMEGCIRAYFNGDTTPELVSSGFEDYFTGTYYFQSGRYATALSGVTHLDTNDRTVSAYRFHDADPLFFQKGLRLTCRDGDTEHGTKDGPAWGFSQYRYHDLCVGLPVVNSHEETEHFKQSNTVA